MEKMMSPNNSVYWVPLAGVVDPSALTAVELLAGTDLSKAIVTGYKLGSMKSDVNNSKDITQEGDVDTPTFGNYEGDITFFRSDLVDVEAVYDTAFSLFKVGRTQGYLVHRLGMKQSVVAAAGQEVSIYSFTADYGRDEDGAKGEPIKFQVVFKQLGFKKLNFALL